MSYQQSAENCKVLQQLQNASGTTKCDKLLLQSALRITKCDILLSHSG